jgi:hypothetical protein
VDILCRAQRPSPMIASMTARTAPTAAPRGDVRVRMRMCA